MSSFPENWASKRPSNGTIKGVIKLHVKPVVSAGRLHPLRGAYHTFVTRPLAAIAIRMQLDCHCMAFDVIAVLFVDTYTVRGLYSRNEAASSIRLFIVEWHQGSLYTALCLNLCTASLWSRMYFRTFNNTSQSVRVAMRSYLRLFGTSLTGTDTSFLHFCGLDICHIFYYIHYALYFLNLWFVAEMLMCYIFYEL